MPEFLETTVDKFTFKVARDRYYSRDGVWLLESSSVSGVTVRMGLTDYLQQHSGDVAFVNLKRTGTVLSIGDEFAEIETIKVNVGLPTPIAGTILEVNQALTINPEFVNQDPYGKGWLYEFNPANWNSVRASLLDADAYFEFMQSQVDEELKETS